MFQALNQIFMKTRIFTFLLAVCTLTAFQLNAITVTVGASGTYPSISAAIVGVGKISEPLIIELTTDYAQTTDDISAIDGASSTNTVTIRPQGTLTVAGNDTIAGYVWKIDGCQFVTIDGRVNGEGSPVLTLRADTCVGNTFSTAGHLRKTSALRITNSSQVTIQYLNLKGATNENYKSSGTTNAPTMGVVTFAAGCNNVTLDHCDVGPLDNIIGTPTVSILSLGSSVAPNSNIIISNNNIYDYYPYDMNKNTTIPSTGVGVLMYDYNSNCTVSGNSFYKTYEHSYLGFTNNNNARTSAIAIVNTSETGYGFVVKNNFIGGSAPNCGGTHYTADIRNNTSFNAIYLSTSTSGISRIYGNTIKNLMILNHSQVAQLYQSSGIFINGGKVVTGITEAATVAPNIIGDMSPSSVGASASIKYCPTNNNAAFSGIVYNSLAGGDVIIANNQIGGVTVNLFKDYTTIRSGSFVGINIFGTAASTILIDQNQIGNNAIGVAPTSMSIQNFLSRSNYGINVNPALNSATSLTISNNKINNIYHAQQTTTQTYNHGIWVHTAVLCPVAITGNEIRDMVFTNGRVNDTPINWGGAIFCGAQNNSTISGNSIYNISGLDAASTNVIGIQLNPTISTANMNVFSNQIYNLSSNVTRKLGQYGTGCNGILVSGAGGGLQPTLNVYNNMIRLGYDRSGNADMLATNYIGIRDTLIASDLCKVNYIGNTIYIGGSNVALSDSISSIGICIATSSTVNPTRTVKNNLIVNARSNTTGSGAPAYKIKNAVNASGVGHYAIGTGGSATALTNFISNNNDYVAYGTGGVLGRFTSKAEAVDLAAIQSYTGGDLQSIADLSPIFIDATGAIPDLHLNQTNYNYNEGLKFAAVLPAPFNVDFDGNPRHETNPTIGSDEYTGFVTGVSKNGVSNQIILVKGNDITIYNTSPGRVISVYNLNGQNVKQLLSNDGTTSFSLQKGVYMIKVNNEVSKIVI